MAQDLRAERCGVFNHSFATNQGAENLHEISDALGCKSYARYGPQSHDVIICSVLMRTSVVCVPLWAPVLTFCVYAAVAAKGGTGSLTISKAFTSLSLFHLVMGPLASIINSIPQLATSFTSMGRIQTFLNGKERQDNRMTMNDRQEVKGVEDPDVSSAHDLSDSIAEDDSSITAGNEVVPITDDKKASAEILGSSDMIASISGKFSWNEDSEPVINISSWDIQRRDFTLVLGPVGCGKSTLLKALLGELSSFKGFIRTAYSAVSYCDQTPWLPNEAVRNIIIGPSHFDEPWYETVTKACALDTDMRTWPNGDATLVGTKGISMSGGQKHRLVSTLRYRQLSKGSRN